MTGPGELGRSLIAERNATGRSRDEMAAHLRVAPSTLAAWETGRSFPSDDELARIVRLIGWDGPPRRWLVTAVCQHVHTGRSAGEVAERMREGLEHPEQPGKVVIAEVRPVG